LLAYFQIKLSCPGKESFGKVVLARKKSIGGQSSSKEMFTLKFVTHQHVSKIEKEVLFRAVGHPFLVQLLAYFQIKLSCPGKESFGKVVLARKKSIGGQSSSKEMFALKFVPYQHVSKIEKEVLIRAVGHPFLVQLLAYFQIKLRCPGKGTFGKAVLARKKSIGGQSSSKELFALKIVPYQHVSKVEKFLFEQLAILSWSSCSHTSRLS
jgi:sporulation protein YlmC with PRC-barrel domain